eukprot:1016974-Prorocentrum_minimum.AAC.1
MYSLTATYENTRVALRVDVLLKALITVNRKVRRKASAVVTRESVQGVWGELTDGRGELMRIGCEITDG